jgi:hypothetical protein
MTLNINDLRLSDKTIVIVEDDLPSIRYYETLLKSSGADVKIFRTGIYGFPDSADKWH